MMCYTLHQSPILHITISDYDLPLSVAKQKLFATLLFLAGLSGEHPSSAWVSIRANVIP